MGGKRGSSYRAPVQAPNSLQSMQEITIVEAVSEGPIVGLATNDGRSISLNETPLVTEEGAVTYQNVSWEITNGTPDQPPFDIPGVETEIPVSVEVTKDFPKASGLGSGAVSREVKNEYCTHIRITMGVQGLYEQLVSQDRAGDTIGATVSYNVTIKDKNNRVVVNDNVERTDKTTSMAQWAKKYKLSGTAPWTITVTKNYKDNESDYMHNDLYWFSYTEIIGYRMTYPHTACMLIKGNAETFGGSIPGRAYKIKGLIVKVPSNYDPETRTYSGIWDGNFKNAWTDNPAWVLYDLIESGRYGLKKYFPPAKQGNSLCDKWTLYDIGRYCDELVSDGEGGMEPRYSFNGQILGSGSARDVIQSIASNFHGMMYWGSGMVLTAADTPQDPVKSFTQANIIDGNITYSTGSAQERHSVALVTWYDPDNYNNPRIEPVYDWDAYNRYGYRPINVTAYGCTSRGQAYRQGLWTLLTEKEQWQATCEVGLDGYDLMPGEFVRIADPRWMGTRFSGRLESIEGVNVTLDGEVSFLDGESYVLYVIMPDGREEHRNITSTAGTHKTIQIATPFTQTPVDYAVWTISGTDVAPRVFAVRSLEETETGRIRLNLREVMTAKYAELEQNIKFTTTPGRRPTTGALAVPTGLNIVKSSYLDGGNVFQRLTFSWASSGDSAVYEYEYEYKTPSGNWNTFTPKKTFSVDIAAAQSGEYVFRVRSIAMDGRTSEWAEMRYTLEGLTTLPDKPTNLRATPGHRKITLNWDMPSDALVGYFEVLMADSSDVTTANVVGKIYGSTYDVMDLAILETKWFWVRSVSYIDASTYSSLVGPVFATTKALEAEDIPDASISDSKLFPSLSNKIEHPDTSEALIAGILNATTIDKEMEEGANADRSLTTKITQGLDAEAKERLELSAKVNENKALITEETTARVAGDNSLADRITKLSVETDKNLKAGIEKEESARIEGDKATTERIENYSANNNAVVSALQKKVAVSTDNGIAEVLNAVSHDKAMEAEASASRVLTLRANEEASERLKLELKQKESSAKLEQVNEVVNGENGLAAQNYIKTDVNGHIAGYGVYNSGADSEFSVVADKFKVAKSDGTTKPVFELDTQTGEINLDGGLIASGSITGDKINARSRINLGDGGQIVIGEGGIIQIGDNIVIDGGDGSFF